MRHEYTSSSNRKIHAEIHADTRSVRGSVELSVRRDEQSISQSIYGPEYNIIIRNTRFLKRVLNWFWVPVLGAGRFRGRFRGGFRGRRFRGPVSRGVASVLRVRSSERSVISDFLSTDFQLISN